MIDYTFLLPCKNDLKKGASYYLNAMRFKTSAERRDESVAFLKRKRSEGRS
jgi:hypothetical protein